MSLDVLSITESHLNEKISNKQLNIANYKIVRKDRNNGSGGGCIAYVLNCLRLKSLETRDIEGIYNSTSNVLGTVYRAPSNSNFLDSFHTVLGKLWSKYRNVVIVGDLNTDITRSEDGEIVSTHGKKLLGTLQHFNH